MTIPPQSAAPTLTNFVIGPAVDIYSEAVVVKADEGPHRVVANVRRVALEDYFPQRRLTAQNRIDLVDDNKDAIFQVMTRKYERGEWAEEGRFGSTIRVIEIGLADLRAAPPLLDGRVRVQEGAGFQARG